MLQKSVKSYRINRIRLEFKGLFQIDFSAESMRINRIRLEFKGGTTASQIRTFCVLIESDWNLKVFFEPMIRTVRIAVLIESDWNLKSLSYDFCLITTVY